jgi:5-hydroxyisourate hydrolase
MISCHVLDTALGCPARGLRVRLDVLEPAGEWRTLGSALTNEDGRASGLGATEPSQPGTYRLTFDTRAYHEASRQPVFFPWVELVFLTEGAEHYHVPLLLSPFGYSTYRGS